jgi:hypothetical protein
VTCPCCRPCAPVWAYSAIGGISPRQAKQNRLWGLCAEMPDYRHSVTICVALAPSLGLKKSRINDAKVMPSSENGSPNMKSYSAHPISGARRKSISDLK